MAAISLLIYASLLLLIHPSTSIPTYDLPESLPITSYAALGDSYPAGAGAGSPRYVCGRFSDAYPIQIANDTRLDIEHSNFKHLACGGATSTSVLHDQVPFAGDSDLVTITVGGNEVLFFMLLNECVFHWHPFSTCEAALIESRRLLESPSIRDNFDALITGAVERLKPNALLLVTGYAKFFNDETDLCDHASFSRTRPLDYLAKSKRRALNQLVVMLNDVVKAIAEVHGAAYVDLDAAFAGHRFCEDGVHEPDLQRRDTWFFNLPAPDFAAGVREQQVLRRSEMAFEQYTRGFHGVRFPQLEARTFHPTSLGHQGISEEIIRVVKRRMRRVVEVG